MDWVRQRREPIAMVLLVVAGLRLLVGIVAVPVLAADDAYGLFATAALFEADRTFDLLLVLVTAGVAASCVLAPATPQARSIVTLALIETAAAILVALGYGLMGLTSPSGGRWIEFAYLLFALVLPVLAVIGLLRARQATAPITSPNSGHGQGSEVAAVDAPPPAAEPPPLPAAWQPEQATGRVWTTAGEAARGGPGAGWPTQSGSTGWQPIPGSAPGSAPGSTPGSAPGSAPAQLPGSPPAAGSGGGPEPEPSPWSGPR